MASDKRPNKAPSEDPQQMIAVRLTRRQWGQLISAASHHAARYAKRVIAEKFTPEPGHINVNAARVTSLREAIGTIKESLRVNETLRKLADKSDDKEG